MWFWNKRKKKKKGEKDVIISQSCYDKLPQTHKPYFSRVPASPAAVAVTHEVVHHDDSGENFGLSMLVGMETDSTGMGYLAGGSLSGAMFGEMLADHQHADFGGGSGGGAGAGGDWS